MKLCVIGLGYIGLPTAAMFASSGCQVVGVDKNPQILAALKNGDIVIDEKGLGTLVRDVVQQGNLTGSLTPVEADVFLIAVPTPILPDKRADMSYVDAATDSILPFLRKGNTVILESTSPVGTVDERIVPRLESTGLSIGRDLFVGHSPERVIPGQILLELVQNSRIAGGVNRASAEKIAAIYRTFVQGEIHLTDTRTAELCKLAENTYRDVNIAFANELAILCESFGVNAWEAIDLCNKHPRVNVHQPGPGVGGHCIAVDPWFLAEKHPKTAKIITTCRQTNDAMPAHVAGRIASILEGIDHPKVTILGISYKPNVDDVRESPILYLMDILKDQGITVIAWDPLIKDQSDLETDLLQAATGADLLVLGVNHDAVLSLPFAQLATVMRHRQFFDTRNALDRWSIQEAGFSYFLLGEK